MSKLKVLKELRKMLGDLTGTIRYTPPNLRGNRGDYMGNYDTNVDFPYVDDPHEYITHRPLEQDVEEQGEASGLPGGSAKGRNTGSPPGGYC